MNLNSILNQVLDVAKNSASKLETGNQTIDSLTKVGGGAALGGILSMILGRSGGGRFVKNRSLPVFGLSLLNNSQPPRHAENSYAAFFFQKKKKTKQQHHLP